MMNIGNYSISWYNTPMQAILFQAATACGSFDGRSPARESGED
ncbi:MAG: hypothetical protein WBD36_09370 [Bacteroidota bacterium]